MQYNAVIIKLKVKFEVKYRYSSMKGIILRTESNL